MKSCDYSSPRLLATGLLLLTLFVAPGCSASAKKARFLGRAENYFKAGDYEKAKIEYTNVLRTDPQNLTAIQRLGTIWFEQGSTLRAFPYLLGSRQLAPDALDLRTKLGLAFLAVGLPAEARKEALAVLEKDPRHGEAALLLTDSTANPEELAANEQTLKNLPDGKSAYVLQAQAALAVQAQNFSAAQNLLERAQAADPKLPSVHLRMAAVAYAQKDFAKAEREFKAAVELSPPRSPAIVRYAEFKLNTGARDAAKALLTETNHRVPDFLPAWQLQAQIAYSEKNYDGSLALLERIFSVDSDNLEARLLQAENMLVKNEPTKAIEILERLDNAYKTIPLIKFQLARAYLQANNRNQAISVLTQALAIAPDYADATLLLSGLNLTSGDPQATVTALTDLLKKRPGLASAQLMLADALRTLDRLDESVAILDSLSKTSPANPQVYALLGKVQRQQNKVAAARASLTKARELAPDDLNIFAQLIDIDVQDRNYVGAHQKIRDQLQNAPQSAPFYFLDAQVYAAQKDWNSAEAALIKTLDLDPNYSSAYDLLLLTYLAADKLPAALKQLDDLLAKDPRDTRALMTAALIHNQKNDYARASEFYEKLLAVNPNSVTALNNLAYIYNEYLNQIDKAYDLARRARSLQSQDASVADTLGWILYKRADYQQALRLLQEAATKLPDQPEVQFHLGMANYMMGQAAAARTAFQRAATATTDFPGKAEIPRRLALLGADGTAGQALSREELEAALKTTPNDPLALARLGAVYEKERSWEKAADTYQRALAVNPRLFAAVAGMARLFAGPLHDTAKALDFAKTAKELAPDNAQTSALLGRLTYQSGNFLQAYSLLRDALRELPDEPGARFDFALAAYHLGRVDEARQIVQGLLVSGARINTQQAQDARRFLALTAPEQTAQTLSTLEPEAQQALQADPRYVPALMIRGAVQAQHGETKGAIDTYTNVLQRAPDFVPAQVRLAALYLLDSSKLDKAYELASKARKAAPDDSEVATVLAEASYQRKEYAYAVQLFQESARQHPLGAESLFHLGISYLQTKQSVLGQEALTKALAAGLTESSANEAKRALAEARASN